MNRMLTALLLAFATSGALAAEGEQEPAPSTGCPKSEQTPAKLAPSETNGNAGSPGATAPVRPRSDARSRGGPRWHSLLPGMIR